MDRNYRKKDVKRAQTRRPTKERRENPIVVLLSLFFLPAFLFFCEFTLKISLFGSIDLKELFLALLFSASTGITITLVCRAIACGIASLAENKQVIRPLCAVLVGICSAAFLILFLVQYVYFSFFGDFFKWSTLDMAGDVTQFYRETLATMAKGWYWIL